jgi:hypothetical protein
MKNKNGKQLSINEIARDSSVIPLLIRQAFCSFSSSSWAGGSLFAKFKVKLKSVTSTCN